LLTSSIRACSLSWESRLPCQLGCARQLTSSFSLGRYFTIELVVFNIEFSLVFTIELVDWLFTLKDLKILLFKIFGWTESSLVLADEAYIQVTMNKIIGESDSIILLHTLIEIGGKYILLDYQFCLGAI
jgi:hypothetical protein